MIVTTGAGGKLGRLVAEALAERGATAEVTLTTRSPEKIADLAAQGFRTAKADYDDPAGMEAAFAGAEVLLLVSADGPNEPRKHQHRAAIDAAKRARVQRVVYTSFTNPVNDSLFPFAWIHADTEAYLKASGLPYTILRNNQYAENLGSALAAAKDSGTLALPGAHGKVAYITRRDIAAAIAGALTQGGHAGKTYELTGPEAVDLAAVAAALSETLGRPVTALDADPKAFGERLASFGLPPFVVEALLGLYAAAAAGECAAVSDDAARLAGRPTESVLSYVRRFAGQ